MLTKSIAAFMLVLGFMQNSFTSSMPDRNIDNPIFVVNRNHLISCFYQPELSKISVYDVTREVSRDIEEPLREIVSAAKSDGLNLHIVSGYRSYKKQTHVFDKKMNKVKDMEKALNFVALPGSSEHQLGRCADVSYANWQGLNKSFENTKQGKWVRANCYDYGFIIRYLPGYERITGYLYEPWHIRYVGTEHAKKIKEMGEISLEQYVSRLRKEKYQEILNTESFQWKYK